MQKFDGELQSCIPGFYAGPKNPRVTFSSEGISFCHETYQLLSTKTVRFPPKPTRSATREIGTTVAVGKTSVPCDACSKLQIRGFPFFSDTCLEDGVSRIQYILRACYKFNSSRLLTEDFSWLNVQQVASTAYCNASGSIEVASDVRFKMFWLSGGHTCRGAEWIVRAGSIWKPVVED